MTESAFQDYWLNVHAVKYASKIPQIRRYMVCPRIDFEGQRQEEPPFSGVAEIWLHPEEQIASLQSSEFLQGARTDEPRWAAFWATLALDTNAHVIEPRPPLSGRSSRVKLYRLLRRRAGLPLAEFRSFALGRYAEGVRRVPGLRHYLQCHALDGLYRIGEPPFDAVEQISFDDLPALEAALKSPEFHHEVQELQPLVIDTDHLVTLAAREHWIIGPEEREDQL